MDVVINGFVCRLCKQVSDVKDFRRCYLACKSCNNLKVNANSKKFLKANPKNGNIEKARASRRKWNKSEKCKLGRRDQIDNLKDKYIKARLYSKGFPWGEITPELIELQRIILKTKRLCKTSQN